MTLVVLRGTPLPRWLPCLREEDRTPEKKALAAALIERVAAACRDRRITLGFVIFYPDVELERPSWRASFLRETLDRLGVPYLDTAEPLLHAVRSGAVSFDDLFDPTTRHHSVMANELIVQALQAWWPALRSMRAAPLIVPRSNR